MNVLPSCLWSRDRRRRPLLLPASDLQKPDSVTSQSSQLALYWTPKWNHIVQSEYRMVNMHAHRLIHEIITSNKICHFLFILNLRTCKWKLRSYLHTYWIVCTLYLFQIKVKLTLISIRSSFIPALSSSVWPSKSTLQSSVLACDDNDNGETDDFVCDGRLLDLRLFWMGALRPLNRCKE